MIDLILAGIGLALSNGGESDAKPMPEETVIIEQAFEAEPQQPTGKFTTATEVKPILGVTKASWVAVREYEGQDLFYVTHLLSWRCGLHEMRYSINGAPLEAWPMPPCHEETAYPNAIGPDDGLPFAEYPLGSIETIAIEVLYDDLSTDGATFNRDAVLMR